VYLLDNSAILAALSEANFQLRGVVAVDRTIGKTELQQMSALGVCGARLTLAVRNGVTIDDVADLAEKIADFGWHIQVTAAGLDVANNFAALAAIPADLVFDHTARPNVADGLHGASFQALLRLMERGRCWVKLSAPMRWSEKPFPYADILPLIRELARLFPERLLWGSDWPHTTIGGEMPDDGALLDLLLDWIPDQRTRDRILVDNPAEFYRFQK
jgi:predicted TIM-barrel fold metal-dependent hydrolase